MTGLVLLLALTFLGPYLSFGGDPFTGEGNPVRQAGYVSVFALVAYALRPTANPERLLALPLSLIVALGWCWLSIGWSVAPGIATRRLFLTTMIIWIIFATVRQLGLQSTLTATRALLVPLLVLNFASVFLLPDIAIHQVSELTELTVIGSWRGLLIHKNFAGAVCAFTVLLFLFEARNVRWMVRLAVLAGACIFLWGTQSKTSMGLLAAAILLGGLFLAYDPRYRSLVIPAALVLACAATLLVIFFWQDIMAPFYHPDAFTGRVQIWRMLVRFAGDNLMLGAGYGSFWNVGEGVSPAYQYGEGWEREPGNAHSGYLDLLVQIGLPGLLLVVFAMFILPTAKLFADHSMTRQQRALLFGMLAFCLGHNFTESSLFERDTIVQVFLTLAVAMIHAGGAVGLSARSPLLRRRKRTGGVDHRPAGSAGEVPAP